MDKGAWYFQKQPVHSRSSFHPGILPSPLEEAVEGKLSQVSYKP